MYEPPIFQCCIAFASQPEEGCSFYMVKEKNGQPSESQVRTHYLFPHRPNEYLTNCEQWNKE